MADEIVKDTAEETTPVENKPEAKPEPKKNETKENAVNKELAEAMDKIASLTTEVEELKVAKTDLENTTVSLNNVTAELKTANDTITEYEKLIANLVDEKVKKIPEDLQDLVPSNMTLVQKLEWITKAESKNMFNKKVVDDMEIGKPMNTNAPKVDTDKMSASSLFSLAYNTIKK